MTWTHDKEAEHQRSRADFAEAEVERLRERVQQLEQVLAERWAGSA